MSQLWNKVGWRRWVKLTSGVNVSFTAFVSLNLLPRQKVNIFSTPADHLEQRRLSTNERKLTVILSTRRHAGRDQAALLPSHLCENKLEAKVAIKWTKVMEIWCWDRDEVDGSTWKLIRYDIQSLLSIWTLHTETHTSFGRTDPDRGQGSGVRPAY